MTEVDGFACHFITGFCRASVVSRSKACALDRVRAAALSA
jgi:hypothetical protein